MEVTLIPWIQDIEMEVPIPVWIQYIDMEVPSPSMESGHSYGGPLSIHVFRTRIWRSPSIHGFRTQMWKSPLHPWIQDIDMEVPSPSMDSGHKYEDSLPSKDSGHR